MVDKWFNVEVYPKEGCVVHITVTCGKHKVAKLILEYYNPTKEQRVTGHYLYNNLIYVVGEFEDQHHHPFHQYHLE